MIRTLFVSIVCVLVVANVVARSSTPAAAASVVRPAYADAEYNDWPTYGFDNHRNGFNPNTAAFTPQNLARLHLAWTADLGDYDTQTQPILILHVGTHRGITLVGGASGTLQAFDAFTGARIWQRALGSQTLSCGGSGTFAIGIGGTAVYDPTQRVAYVVDSVNFGTNAPSYLKVHRIDPATGLDTAPPVGIAPAPLAGELNTAHTSLALAPDGALYLGTGSTCDIASWRGRVAVVDTRTMTLRDTFFTVYTPAAPFSGGGVWGWGGVAIDDPGHVFFGVGNADAAGRAAPPFANAPDERAGYAERLVETSPWLASVIASNDPGFTYGGNSVDLDLTGTPILALPIGCPTIAGMQGKAGQLLFYDAQAIGAGPIGRFQLSSSSYRAAYLGNPGYSPKTELVYDAVPTSYGGSLERPGLIAFDISHCTPEIAWATAFGADSYAIGGAPRAAPVATSGGIVFAGTPTAKGGELWALDAVTGTVLNGGAPILRTGASIRMAPVISGDRLWLLDNGGDLYAMTLDPNVPAIANRTRATSREIRSLREISTLAP